MKVLLRSSMVLCILFWAHATLAENIPNNYKQIETTGPNNPVAPNQNVVMSPYAPSPPPSVPATAAGIVTAEDANIAITIQTLIVQNKILAGSNIRVTCQQGMVTLMGAVNSMSQVTEATNVANSVPGVKSVSSKLTIN